jgi:hypothetical protein
MLLNEVIHSIYDQRAQHFSCLSNEQMFFFIPKHDLTFLCYLYLDTTAVTRFLQDAHQDGELEQVWV